MQHLLSYAGIVVLSLVERTEITAGQALALYSLAKSPLLIRTYEFR